MKIVIGIIVVLGLGWLLLGGSGEEASDPDVPATEEVMEEGEAMMEEGEAMMVEGEGHSGDDMVVEDDTMMEEGADAAPEGDAMMEEETPAQ